MFKLLENIIELFGWLKIAASPSLLSVLIAAYIYVPEPNETNLTIGILVIVIGVIVGVLWANKILKSKDGTMAFLAKINSAPELNELDQEPQYKSKHENTIQNMKE